MPTERVKDNLKHLLGPAAVYLAVNMTVCFVWEDLLHLGEKTSLSAVPGGITALICIPLFLLWYRRLLKGSPDQSADRDEKGTMPAQNRAAQALFLLLTILAGAALSLLWGTAADSLRLYRLFPAPAQDALYGSLLPLQIPVFGFLTPLCEELLFRGILYTALTRIMKDMPAGILTCILFSVFHGSPVQAAYAFLMGLCLQLLRRRDPYLVLPTAFHAGANLAAVLAKSI